MISKKDKEFADLYRGGPDSVRGNAKRCYMMIHPRAKPRSAETDGPALLRKAQVKQYLAEKSAESCARADVTEDAVIEQLRRIGFSDVRKLFTESGALRRIVDLDDHTAAAVSSVQVVTRQVADGDGEVECVHKIKLADKRGPLELLCKYMSLLTDRVDVKHSGLDALLESIAEMASSTPAGRIKERESKRSK